MRVDIATENQIAIVKPHGPIDASSAHTFKDVLARLANSAFRSVTLDLSAVPIITSAGLACCLHPFHQLLQRSRCAVTGTRPNVRRIFELAGMKHLVAVGDSIERASAYNKTLKTSSTSSN